MWFQENKTCIEEFINSDFFLYNACLSSCPCYSQSDFKTKLLTVRLSRPKFKEKEEPGHEPYVLPGMKKRSGYQTSTTIESYGSKKILK